MEHSIREKIIDLLLRTDDDKLLEQVYAVLDSAINAPNNGIWNNLTAEERNETLLSLEESNTADNLVDNEEVRREIRAKLGWA